MTAYFQRNWLPIKYECVSCFKTKHFTLGEQTNNRLESLNGKIKSVCSWFASLYNFFADFCVLRVLRGERDHSSIIARVSKSTHEVANVTDDDRQYQALLTPHAFDLVLSQIARHETVQLPGNGVPVQSSEGPLTMTESLCTCALRCSFRLPCRHIFARRQACGMSSFDAALADSWWTVGYGVDCLSSVSSVRVTEMAAPPTALTAHQKYRQAMIVASDLASFAFEVGMSLLRERMQILQDL